MRHATTSSHHFSLLFFFHGGGETALGVNLKVDLQGRKCESLSKAQALPKILSHREMQRSSSEVLMFD